MSLAPEGLREMVVATVVLGGGGWLAVGMGYWPIALPLSLVWLWSISFFRDPHRVTNCAAGELCAPADGTVTEISHLEHEPHIDGPAIRVGIFLSIFNVHINRSPCAGTVLSSTYKPGKFLDARHPDSGRLNESNTLVVNPADPIRGPIVVRQVSGLIARRIICHAKEGTSLSAGQRFGLIKFGSRTELIVPDDGAVDILVERGAKVRAGLTILARQRALTNSGECDAGHRQTSPIRTPATA